MKAGLALRVATAYRDALTRGTSNADAYFAALAIYLDHYPHLSETQAGIEVANILLASAPQDEAA